MNLALPALTASHASLIPNPPCTGWTEDEVRAELRRILRSRFFVKSTRLSCFLSTAIDYLLTGKAASFKEYTVGREVYGRSDNYDPIYDTIVRTEARRLRLKLKEYYSEAGAQSRLRITLVPGSYVPQIETTTPSTRQHRYGFVDNIPRTQPDFPLSLAVVSFQARATEPASQNLAAYLEEALTHEIAQVPGIRVFRAAWNGPGAAESSHEYLNRIGIRFALRGYVHQWNEERIVQLQVTTMEGLILWSERFHGDSSARLHEIASAVSHTCFHSAAPEACSLPLSS